MSESRVKGALRASKAYLQEHGRCVTDGSDEEGRVCPIVAVSCVIHGDWSLQDDVLYALRAVMPDASRALIVAFNEDPATTDEMVYDLFDRAIATVDA